MTYAIETGSFVIVATAPLTEQNLDVIAHDMPAARENLGIGGGLAQIFDPEGRAIGVRPAHDAQALCIAEIDPARCLIAKSALDPVGHYGRPDIFQLSFDNRPRQHVLAGHHGSIRVRSGELRKSRMDVFSSHSSDSTSD
jgi:nitrilase